MSSAADGSGKGVPRPCQRLFLPAPDPCSPPLASELARLAAASKPAAQQSNSPAAAVVNDPDNCAAQSESPAAGVEGSASAPEASCRLSCVSATSLSHAIACATSVDVSRHAPSAAGGPSEQLMPQNEAAAACDTPARSEAEERPPAGVSAAETAAMVHLVSGLRSVALGRDVLMTLQKAASEEEDGSDAPGTPRKVISNVGS